MEHFEGRNREPEDSSNSRPFKIPRQDIASGLQTRKAAFEKFASKGYGVCSAGPSTHHKPIQPEPSLAVKPSSGDETEEDPKPSHLSSVAQKFGVQLQPTNRGNDEKPGCAKFSIKTSDPSKEDPKPLNRKPAWNKFLALPDKEKSSLGLKPNLNFPSQENEAKPEFSKVAAIREKLRSATQENELKPPVSKRPSAQKPSLNKEVSQNEDTSNKSGFQQKQSGLQETVMENTKGKGTGTAKSILVNKSRQEKSDSSHKLHKTNKAPAAGRQSDETKQKDDRDRSSRKPKPLILPAVFRMSQVPEKPSRPPTVYLGMF
ncbi:FYB1 protein, partial [Regulus satrapa]|nr:FYB1 protein [Regulus satrapa]